MRVMTRPGTILFILLLAVLAYMFIEPYWIQVKVYRETSHDIPKAFRGMKIVFISDIHHSQFFSLERVKNLVKRVNELNPDLILLGGDYVNREEYMENCFDALKELKANMGVYAVLGNHDNWAGNEASKRYINRAGIHLLDNTSTWIYKDGERIKLGGVGDLWTQKQNLNGTIADVDQSDYVVLLSHNPDYVEKIKTNKVDLVLSGHNHGGQVTLFGLWGKTSSAYGLKYRTGLVRTEYTKVLVSNGVGTVFYPMRFWARPQINVIYLEGNNN